MEHPPSHQNHENSYKGPPTSVTTTGGPGGGQGPGGQGGGGGFSGIYESAAFANILIEFETENREMAVDVPDSFVAQTKTPPKYPPPSSLGDREEARSSGSSFSAVSLSNGHSLHRGRSRQSPPELVTLPSRDHLRIGMFYKQRFFEKKISNIRLVSLKIKQPQEHLSNRKHQKQPHCAKPT